MTRSVSAAPTSKSYRYLVVAGWRWSTLNFMDRQSMSIPQEPIRRSWASPKPTRSSQAWPSRFFLQPPSSCWLALGRGR